MIQRQMTRINIITFGGQQTAVSNKQVNIQYHNTSVDMKERMNVISYVVRLFVLNFIQITIHNK